MPYIIQHIPTGKFYRGRTMKKLLSGDKLGRHSKVDINGVAERTDPKNPTHVIAKCFVRNPKSVQFYKKYPLPFSLREEVLRRILNEECRVLKVDENWKTSLTISESWKIWGKPKDS